MGYYYSGCKVFGVDIREQPHYPFDFLRIDALKLSMAFLRGFDFIHASPPCQAYSVMASSGHPDLIEEVRSRLIESGRPYVIENIMRAPLHDPVMLCGQMFGLELFRHRIFEASWPLAQPEHKKHTMVGSKAGRWKPGRVMSVVGNFGPLEAGSFAMDIGWMNKKELAQAIPPAYTQYIARDYRLAIRKRRTGF